MKFTEEIIQGYLRVGTNGEEDVLKIEPYRNHGGEIVAELLRDSFSRKTVTVRYYICEEEMSLDEASETFIRKVLGLGEVDGEMDAEYSVAYSDITGHLWTDEGINIGGHDLLEELYSYAGRYLILVVDVHD